MSAISSATELPPAEFHSAADRTGSELKRGMFFNTIALLASNFRGIFTFLIARLLGAAVLGTYLVAWATTDILCKIGMFGLDNAIIPFIARAEVAGERARSRALFHLAVFLALAQSAVVAAIAIVVIRLAGDILRPRSAHDGGAFGSALCHARREFVSDLHRGLARDEGNEARHLVARADGIGCHNDRISRNGGARLEGLRRRDCRHHRHGRVRARCAVRWPPRSFVPRPRRAAQFPIASKLAGYSLTRPRSVATI